MTSPSGNADAEQGPSGAETPADEVGITPSQPPGGGAGEGDPGPAEVGEGRSSESPTHPRQSQGEVPDDSSPSVIGAPADCAICERAAADLAEADANATSITRKVAEAEVEYRALERQATKTGEEVEDLEGDFAILDETQKSLQEWVSQRSDSFAWKLLRSLHDDRIRASGDAAQAQTWLEGGIRNFRPIPLGNTRPHRLLLGLVTAAVAVVGLLAVLIAIRQRAPMANLYLPDVLSMVGDALMLWLAIAIGLWFAYERAHAAKVLAERDEQMRAQTWKGQIQLDQGYQGLMYLDFSKGLITPILWLILAAQAVIWLKRVLPLSVSQFIPSPWIIWLAVAIIYIAIAISVTYRYYAGVSRLRGELMRLQGQATYHREVFVHASREESRLNAMHQSIPEFFEALALPVHRPWLVDSSDVSDRAVHPDVERFPACVGLAYASDADPDEVPKMRVLSRAALVSPGWLSSALANAVELVGSTAGVRMSVESLDADPGDNRVGPRRLMVERSQDQQLLLRLGRRKLRELAGRVQMAAVKEIKPRVRPLRDDGLGDLERGTSRLLAENPGTVPWNEFLEGALATPAPFSLLTFTERARAQTPQRIESTIAIVPQDLEQSARRRRFDVVPIQDDGSSRLDLVVRIDRSAWLDPSVLTIFQGESPPRASELGDGLVGLPPTPPGL